MGNSTSSLDKLYKLDPNLVDDIPMKGRKIPAKVSKVYDGDTIEVVFLYGDLPMKIWVRLYDVDTPELKGKGVDKLHKGAGRYVRDWVKRTILNNIVDVKLYKWNSFGGRIDGEIFIDDISLSTKLIGLGYGKLYKGGPKEEWNEEELKRIVGYLWDDNLGDIDYISD